jgi:hypothetical protein
MDLSTVVVLSALTLGNILLPTCGVFVLWLAGEIGDRGRDHEGATAGNAVSRPSDSLLRKASFPGGRHEYRSGS